MNGKIHLDNTNRYLDNLDNLDNTNRNKLKRKEIPYINTLVVISSVQFNRSVVSDSLRPHELQQARPPCPSPTPEFTQTHIHRVGDAIQPSHPLSSPSPPAPNPSQHQSLSQRVNSSHEVAKVLEFQL